MKTRHNASRLKSTMTVAAAAAGLTTALAGQADAADLNTNLVVNGDFETTTGPGAFGGNYGANVSGWSQGTFTSPSASATYAYFYATDYDNRDGNTVPPGNDFTSTTDFFWSMNANDDSTTYQVIDLSSGDAAAAIAAGQAQYDVSAYLTSFGGNLESGRMTLEFLDGTNAVLGSAITFDDPDRTQWSLVGGTGVIPTAAVSAVVTFGRDPDFGQTGGPDIYVDNVSFEVVPEPSSLALLGLGGLLIARRRRG